MAAAAVRLLALLHCIAPVSSACASVDPAQSSGWLDRDGVTNKFSIQFHVSRWVSFTQISLTWPGEVVNVEHVYNAETAPGGAHGQTVVIALGRTATNPPQFVIMGTGTQSIRPRIECNTASQTSLPPPSPPHATACPLEPTYNTLNTWDRGENVEIVFRTWRDAGLVHLRYWGQTALQLEAPIGASVKTTTVVDGATLITLQLGTSCEDRVVDADGVIVSQPGQMMNCVPHRAETMHVTFNLRPPALHPPQISCHEHEPPPPPPPGSGFIGGATAGPAIGIGGGGAPADALNGGYAPQFRPPPSPRPPSPPPTISVGSSVRSLPDCAIGATARVVQLQPASGGTESARIEIEPEHWLEGYIFLLGVSGSQLDIRDDVMHAVRLTPIIDPSGTMVLFGFTLRARPDDGDAVVELTITGSALNLRQVTCRPAPAPPPAIIEDSSPAVEELVTTSTVREFVTTLPYGEKLDFIFIDATMSDLLLIGLAVFLTVFMAVRHLCAACRGDGGGRHQRARGDGQELPMSENGLGARAYRGGARGESGSRPRESGRQWRRHDDDDDDSASEEDEEASNRRAQVVD